MAAISPGKPEPKGFDQPHKITEPDIAGTVENEREGFAGIHAASPS